VGPATTMEGMAEGVIKSRNLAVKASHTPANGIAN
jgi:hypothetical protein